MTRLVDTLRSSWTAQETFDLLADFRRAKEWDPSVVSVERTSGDGGPGTTYDLVAKVAGRPVPLVYTVTEHDAPRRVVLVGEGKTGRLFDAIDVVEDANGVRVTYAAELELGALKVAAPLVGLAFKRLFANARGRLAEVLRTPPAAAP